jgi:hypothetical protein
MGRSAGVAMPYKITYEPILPTAAARPRTVEFATASEAWASVLILIANAEKTSILDEHGKAISRDELRARARKEAN